MVKQDVVLAVDPGIRGCGVALFVEEKLVACAYVANSCRTGALAREAAAMAVKISEWVEAFEADNHYLRVVVEWPQVYQGGKQKGDPADLLPLAGIGAALGVLCPSIRTVLPREWKGQVPKDVMGRRILSKLTPEETGIVDACAVIKSLKHNVVDAVGLGLFDADRLDSKVPPRARGIFARIGALKTLWKGNADADDDGKGRSE